MKTVMLIGVAAISLTACNRLPFFSGVESPHRKPGLWEQTRQSDRGPTPVVTRWCFDAASDRQFPVLGRRPRPAGGEGGGGFAAACKPPTTVKNGDTFVTDVKCDIAGVSRAIHSATSGDFNARYTTTTTINTQGDPDPSRNGQRTMTVTSVFKGACPPELSPGQMEGPDGQVIDMAQLRRGGGAFGGGARGEGGGGPGGGGGGPGGGGQ